MAGRRVHKVESQLLVDELQDALRRPFHPLNAFSTPSGGVRVLGYRVSTSWVQHRIFGLILPDPEPTDITEGTLLLEYPQARCYFIPDPTGNRLEMVEIQTWFRHRNDEDLTTVGPWIKGPIVSGVAATEILAPTLYYREMYLQILSYTPNGSAAVSLTFFAAGAAGMDAEVSVSMTIPGGMVVTQPTAASLNCTEASAAGILADTTDIEIATEKVATEVVVGDGLAVRQATAAKLNMTEASGATIAGRLVSGALSAAALLQQVYDAVIAQDGAVGKAMTAGAQLVDPAAWPADGAAGTARRLISNLKGMLVTTAGTLAYGEGDTVPQLRVQHRNHFGTARTTTGTAVDVPCVLRAISVTAFVAGDVLTIRDSGAAGTIRFVWAIDANGIIELGSGVFAVDVHFTFGAALDATITALFAPTA